MTYSSILCERHHRELTSDEHVKNFGHSLQEKCCICGSQNTISCVKVSKEKIDSYKKEGNMNFSEALEYVNSGGKVMHPSYNPCNYLAKSSSGVLRWHSSDGTVSDLVDHYLSLGVMSSNNWKKYVKVLTTLEAIQILLKGGRIKHVGGEREYTSSELTIHDIDGYNDWVEA